MFHYYQIEGGEERWEPVPLDHLRRVREKQQPMFVTILAVSKLVEDLSYEDKLKLAYWGPFYVDWDSDDEQLVIKKVNAFLDKLEALGVDLAMCRLYATGGRGYHLEVPPEVLIDKVYKHGYVGLPVVYKELALKLMVDTLDLRVYSTGRGRMWRQPNVRRPNGRYKVAITPAEMREMTPELNHALTAEPRPLIVPKAPELCVKLSVEFSSCAQKVEDLLKKRAKYKPDPKLREKATSHSVLWMMAGLGIKPDVGFHQLSLQLAIAAATAGWSEQQLVTECEGLINSHESDSSRYNTPAKRREELARMWRYVNGNPCYEFSVGAIKNMLEHPAPDLDGITASRDDVKEAIDEAATQREIEAEGDGGKEVEQDEYADVARGVTLSKYGVYTDTDSGKKRVCAVSFAKPRVLLSCEASQIIGYDCDILVNGKRVGVQTLELDVFSGLVPFNRFVSRYGHAFQGTDVQVRTVMMRFVEMSKKQSSTSYVVVREGLDLVQINNHSDERLRQPFLIWADGNGTAHEDAVADTGISLKYAGFPDPRGVFRTDIALAPKLIPWLDEPGNRELLREVLQNLFTCQRADVLGKLLGWYVACFWKQLFQKHYGKFPLMHVNGPAGLGKCLAKDTPVIMADGSVRLVQDVQVGDRLLGPDGGIRNVLSLAQGRDQMYRVTPVKGDPYVVNSAHILSLKKSGRSYGLKLSDGAYVPADADVVNVNVEVFANSSTTVRKDLKGWRSDAVEFHRPASDLKIEPYALGLWLGDGKHTEPSICKPFGPVVRWWVQYAKRLDCDVTKYQYRGAECPSWYITSGPTREANPLIDMLRGYDLLGNKHIPESYKLASLADRLQLLAGLIDTDGYLIDNNYEWVSKSEQMARDFAFICRSVGLACYIKQVRKGIKSAGFEGTYWKCVVSGDVEKIPCLAKSAAPRQQIKRATVTGITVEPIGEGDYYGFELDGDKLFLLGDFTVTHNTELNIAISSLFYWQNPARPLSPGSTNFALVQHLTASSSIPLILDEYKPHEMRKERHDSLKALFRDAYNQRDNARGGGSREADDYRVLQFSQLAAPLCFIAEAAEDEAAVMERVVLVTLARPPQAQQVKNYARFQAFQRHHHLLGILGQYIAAEILSTGAAGFVEEFDEIYNAARERFMLSEKDLSAGLSDAEIMDRQNTKERPVFNHSVALFGLRKLRALVKDAVGDGLDDLMGEMEDGVFARLSDLHAATTPEYVKVLREIAAMSYTVEKDRPEAVRKGMEYALVPLGGRSCVELALRPAYNKYRMYCRSAAINPLYSGPEALAHAIADSPAFVKKGTGEVLQMPGVYTFDVEELARLGVDLFKA